MALVCPVLQDEKLYIQERWKLSEKSRDSCRTVQTFVKPSVPERVGRGGAVLSARRAQHAARRGSGGSGTVVGAVFV